MGMLYYAKIGGVTNTESRIVVKNRPNVLVGAPMLLKTSEVRIAIPIANR